MPRADEFDPAEILPSEHNPRLVFDADELQALRESIDEVGILVPLTVYEDDDGRVRLIDGERRLRCALELGHEKVPCYVVDDVEETAELEWMFSIHMMREDWEDGPVARALRDLADRLGGWDTDTLKAVTGMTAQQLNYFKALADAPSEILDRVISHELPANLVADSILRVAKPLRRDLPELAGDRSDADFITAMVEKRDAGKLEDVVALRDLRTMIRVAAEEVEDDEERVELIEAIRRVIDDAAVSIEEAYADTVEVRVAAESFQKGIDRFLRTSKHVVRQVEEDREAASELADKLEELAHGLMELVDRLRNVT